MNITKHIGKYGEKPCVVVFREVPNEPENCLIVQTATLPSNMHDELMSAVQSAEAQQANNVADVLQRKLFNDGSAILSTLHYQKFIQKVPVSLVSLNPTPTQDIALADLNAEIRKIEGGYTPPKTDGSYLNESTTPPNTADNDAVPVTEDEAQSLLVQAELLEQDAKSLLADAEKKREQAYQVNPDLKPKKKGPGRPKKNA